VVSVNAATAARRCFFRIASSTSEVRTLA
jgi:hypothetical protein